MLGQCGETKFEEDTRESLHGRLWINSELLKAGRRSLERRIARGVLSTARLSPSIIRFYRKTVYCMFCLAEPLGHMSADARTTTQEQIERGFGWRELGKTGLKVSPLGFGASPLGGVFGPVTEQAAIASVHEAVRLGINFFDVSPYYGDTLAEKALGKALKTLPFPREQLVISTKCGRYGEGFDFSADRVVASVDESLKRLNVDYIDIIHCHDIEFGSLDQIITETIPALSKLKETGKVRFIGITGLPLKIFHYVLDRVPPGTINVVLSYCHYSLNDVSLGNSLPYLKTKGVGVISASPLSMGLLTDQGPPDWHPAPQKLKNACASAAALCGTKGKSISQLALQFAVSNPEISTTVVGMCSAEQVHRNIQAVKDVLDNNIGGGLDEEILEEVETVLHPVKNMTWHSGREENN